MKHTETPNNNPYLAAAVCFSIMLIAAVLFVFTANYRQYGFGDTDGGTAYFGSGSGNGSGSGDGDGSGNEEGNGDGDTRGTAGVDGEKDDGGKAEKGEPDGDKEVEVSGSGKQNSGNTSGGSSQSAAGNVKNSGKINYRDMGIAEIFTGKDPVKEVESEQEETNTDDNRGNKSGPARRPGVSGRQTFSSGGKSVFRIRKHENVLFIIDVSGSMAALTQERQSRLQVLQHQLKRTIYSMNKAESNGKFSILAFSDTVNYFPERGLRMSFVSRKYCDSAAKWINMLSAGGGTNLGMAMDETVKLIRKKKINIDCIYLLTDGEPTDIYDEREFLANLKKRIPRQIKIFTISIGRKSELLQDIAKAFKGEYNQYN